MNYFKMLTLALLLVFAFGTVSAQTAYTTLIGVRETENGYLGVSANVTVSITAGTGHVFIDTMPLTQIDTQASARLAQEVACETLRIDCSDHDFFYIIRGNYEFIGGPSAGAAMTAATLAALQEVPLSTDVMISGTINPSGDIGPVGGILQKAEAAYKNNATLFLIPEGQAIEYEEKTGENVNIINYAKDHWKMRVIEVSNIIEAYKYMSGYEIKEPKVSSADIASERYSNLMKGLSDMLMNDAQTKITETSTKLTSSNLSFVYVDELNNILIQAENELNDAKSVYNEKQYYSAASLAVRSYIHSYYSFKKADYYATNTNESVREQISQVRTEIGAFETMFLKNRNVDNIDDIEIFAVVIDRITESESVIDEALDAYDKGDIDTALYLTAYAEVRKNTAYDWLTTVDLLKGDQTLYFDHSKVKPLSQERVDQSRIAIAYAQTVSQNQILDDAVIHQAKAEKALDEGKYVFALFEAAKARAEANLAMEARALTNTSVFVKITSLEKDAQTAIKESEEEGYLPVLALSYLEFGKTLRDTEPVQSLIYLSYSEEMAKISKDLIQATTGENPLAETPVQITRYYEYVVRIDYSQRILEAAILLTSGVLVGFLAAIYLHQKKKL